MEEQLAALYPKLAKKIAAMIPVRWDVFHYLGEVEQDRRSYSSVFYFKDAAQGKFIQSNEIPKLYQVPKSAYLTRWMQLNDILLEAYDCFVENGKKPWEQMSLTVDSTGKFQLNYRYDVMHPKDGGQLVRELLWTRDTFGYVPDAGSQAVLDRYFAEQAK